MSLAPGSTPLIAGAFDQASTAVQTGNSAAAAQVTTFSTLPVEGSTVFAVMQWKGTSTISSVKDNGDTQTTLSLDKTKTFGSGSSLHTLAIYRGNNIVLPSAGSYTVTFTFSSSSGISLGGGAVTAIGLQPVGPSASNVATASSTTSVSTGACAAPSAGAFFYVFAMGDNSSVNPETVTYTGPGAQRVSNLNGGSQVFALSTFAGNGSQTGTWTTGDSVTYNGAVCAYPAMVIPETMPNQALMRAACW